jgi:hypothetical protein
MFPRLPISGELNENYQIEKEIEKIFYLAEMSSYFPTPPEKDYKLKIF